MKLKVVLPTLLTLQLVSMSDLSWWISSTLILLFLFELAYLAVQIDVAADTDFCNILRDSSTISSSFKKCSYENFFTEKCFH